MAVSNLKFAAQVDDWTRETEQRMTAVFRQSADDVIAEMQRPVGEGGNMLVDTGFLRKSMQVSVNGSPAAPSRENPGGSHSYNPSAASLAIAGAELGDTVYATYSANYAPYVEYGTSTMTGRGFVRLAAAQWQKIVSRVVSRARTQVGRSSR